MKESDDSCCDFFGSYELSKLPAIKRLELSALGCDYGGTSWTTREQVDRAVDALQLRTGSKLLDVGSGSGWPGLLLSSLTGCAVTLLDIPYNALVQARERAVNDKISERVNVVAGSGTAAPFLDESFDRISHSDVLCCLPDKLELLRECRRVATANARMHFSVILPATGISADELDEVIASGPPFVAVDGEYPQLLQQTDWRIDRCESVSAEYEASLSRLLQGINAGSQELARLIGKIEFEAMRTQRERQIELVRRSLLLREVFVAVATG